MLEQAAQVLIVGAGPSGLMLAHELARWGVPIKIIDRALEKSPYSRAIGVQIRTLEIFASLGLLEPLIKKAHQIKALQINTANKAPIDMGSLIGPMIIDQPHTELVLEEALKVLSVEVERGTELIDFGQDSVGIIATLKNHDGSVSHQNFAYIIGADGAHSLVRKKMTNAFIGSSYDDVFILADAECETGADHHTFRLFFTGQGFLALIPMFGVNHYRLISVRRQEKARTDPGPTIEEFQNLINKLVPFKFAIAKLTWVSRFFVQCRSAEHYQDERAFLVGDAAHIHSPAGGQGMNTGIQDSFNLGWKLAMVLRNQASSSLLESYHQERKPVGDYLIKYTDRFFKLMMGGSWLVRVVRRAVLARLAAKKSLRERIFRIGSQTAIRYLDGAICTHTSHLQVANYSIGVRIADLGLMDSHLNKISLQQVAVKNFLSIFLFVPNNLSKKVGKLAIKSIRKISEQFGISYALIFASDFDAEKIVDDDNYLVATDIAIFSDQEQPFFFAIRADHHLLCLGNLKDLNHLECLLSHILRS